MNVPLQKRLPQSTYREMRTTKQLLSGYAQSTNEVLFEAEPLSATQLSIHSSEILGER